MLRLKDLHTQETYLINKRKVKQVSKEIAKSLLTKENSTSHKGEITRSVSKDFNSQVAELDGVGLLNPGLPGDPTGDESTGADKGAHDKAPVRSTDSYQDDSILSNEDVGASSEEEGEIKVPKSTSTVEILNYLGQGAVSSQTTQGGTSEACLLDNKDEGTNGSTPEVWQSVPPTWATITRGYTHYTAPESNQAISLEATPIEKPDVRPNNCVPRDTQQFISNSTVAINLPRLYKNDKAAKFLGIHSIDEPAVNSKGELILECNVYNHKTNWLTWIPVTYFDNVLPGSKAYNKIFTFLRDPTKHRDVGPTIKVALRRLEERIKEKSSQAPEDPSVSHGRRGVVPMLPIDLEL
jgi:hypothetical protein